MSASTWLGAVAVVAAALVTTVSVNRRVRREVSTAPKRLHVVLVGASIGQSWRLEEWPSRAQAPAFTGESVPAWQFDKTDVIAELLMRPARKFRLTRTYVKSLFRPPPRSADVVILKECSSYFPGDAQAYRDSVRKWLRQLRSCNVRIILATVVPVTQGRASLDRRKQEALLDYNRWIREYANEQHIPLLDLEAALRAEGEGSYLRDDFATSDGSHLNAGAYAVLDLTLRTVLCDMVPAAGCKPVTEPPVAQ